MGEDGTPRRARTDDFPPVDDHSHEFAHWSLSSPSQSHSFTCHTKVYLSLFSSSFGKNTTILMDPHSPVVHGCLSPICQPVLRSRISLSASSFATVNWSQTVGRL